MSESPFEGIINDPDAIVTVMTLLGYELDVVTAILVNRFAMPWDEAAQKAETARTRRFTDRRNL